MPFENKCPHCGEPLADWVPDDETGYTDNLLYCASNDCTYFRAGRRRIAIEYAKNFAYRYCVNPHTGSEVPILTKWLRRERPAAAPDDQSGVDTAPEIEPRPSDNEPADKTGVTEQEAQAASPARPRSDIEPEGVRAQEKDAPAEARGETATTGATEEAGRRPEGLEAPRDGTPDDLKRIKGIGPKLEEVLNGMGFHHYDQIAAWGPAELAWVDDNLEGFKGRASRDEWVAQARTLADGGETDFSARSDRGDVDKE